MHLAEASNTITDLHARSVAPENKAFTAFHFALCETSND
jgi:hypothetical protein